MKTNFVLYDSNMNKSANYRNITPLIVPKEDDDDHMNIPFYYIEAAGKDTCK